MKKELIKKIDKCLVENCSACSRCLGKLMEAGNNAEVKTSNELYNREAEQYYFYFLKNLAS